MYLGPTYINIESKAMTKRRPSSITIILATKWLFNGENGSGGGGRKGRVYNRFIAFSVWRIGIESRSPCPILAEIVFPSFHFLWRSA
jgi:hypothetical protein